MNLNYPQGGAIPLPNPSYPMARLNGSAYAAPLNYNQPSEVVGGYDAKINPMTGEEIPQVNFAGGGLASLLTSPYRDSDVMNVRMTPREVAGLQQLAMSYGANERDLYDPVTGQPRFSFLKKILPMIAGAVLPNIGPIGRFAETIGFGSKALGTSILVGGVTGLIEGDLKKGLMAGLGAYSGAKIGEGLSASAEAASKVGGAAEAPKTESTVQTSAPVAPRFTEEGGTIPQVSAPPPPAPITPVQTVTKAPPTGFFGTMGQGISGLMKPEGRTAFMSALGNPLSRTAVFTGVANALTPEQKPLQVGSGAGEDIVYIPGGFNPQYGTGRDQPYQLPGQYYKRTPQGLVPYNPFQLAPRPRGFAQGGAVQLLDENMNPRWSFLPKTAPYIGEKKFAEGGMVPGGPETFTPITISPYAMPTNDPNVLATRAYIEELNRRARFPYGVQGAGGMGGGTGGVLGGGYPFIPGTGGAGVDGGGTPAGGGLGALAGSIAGSYLLNQGIGAGVDYLRDKFGTKKEPQPTQQQTGPTQGSNVPASVAANAALAAASPSTQTAPKVASYEITPVEDPNLPGQSTGEVQGSVVPSKAISPIQYTSAALNILSPFAAATKTALPYVGEPIYDALGNTLGFKYPDGRFEPAEGVTKEPGQLDADLQAKTRAPVTSILSAGTSGLAGLTGLGTATKAGLTSVLPVGSEEVLASYLSPGSSTAANVAATGTSGTAAAGSEAATAGLGKNAILPGLQTALGAYEAFKGIQSGSESRAALGGFGLGAGLAGLGGAGVSSLGGLAAFGATPVGLAAAAIAAIGASLVNTKEYGDVALRNYWNAVDQGRGFGQAPPEELAQGFINFYRTNKNEFAGQQAYGRTGNEQFLYDMTQVINDAVKSGKVNKDVDPTTMYKEVVEPWLNSMGSGPQNADAKRIQDFMMTDLIHNFMAGAPISNAQVKGDTNYDIVSKKPVYAGVPPPVVQMYGQMPAGFQGRPSGIPEGAGRENIFTLDNPFAAREIERESIMPVAGPGGGGSSDVALIPERESIMPVPDFSDVDAGLIPEAPPEKPERYESIMPVGATTPLPEEPVYATPGPYMGPNVAEEDPAFYRRAFEDLQREMAMPVGATTPLPFEERISPIPEPVNPYAEQEARRVEQERFAREQEAFRQAEAQRVEQERMARQAEIDRQEMARQAAYQRQMEYEAQQAAARAEAIRQAEIEAIRRAEEDRARFYVPREEAVPVTSSITEEPYYAAVQPESVPIEQYYAPVEPYNPYGEFYNPYSFADFAPESFMFAQGGAIGDDYNFGFAGGGMPPMSEYRAGGKLLRGQGDGMSDDIPAVIRGKGVQRAALADGEFVIPADVVSHLGNGSTNAGAKKLHQMMARIRQARTGKSRQAPAVKTDRYLPA